MDAESVNSSSTKKQSRFPLHEQFLQRRNSRENIGNGFRLCPLHADRSEKSKGIPARCSPSRAAYRKRLAESFNMNRSRILVFKNKPPMPVETIPNDCSASNQQSKPVKAHRYILQTSERTLDAPDLVDDYYLNLLDWGSSNILASSGKYGVSMGCF